MDNYFNVAGS